MNWPEQQPMPNYLNRHDVMPTGYLTRNLRRWRSHSQKSVLRNRRTRPGFAHYQGLRFDVPAENLQLRMRSNWVLTREVRLDSPFLSGQQRDVIIFPEYRQYLFGRLPRFHRKSYLECQRRRCVLQPDLDRVAVRRPTKMSCRLDMHFRQIQ